MIELVPGAMAGMLLGVTHAVEPDHLAAVSTMVTEQKSPLWGALVGAYWGLGHTLALFVVGAALALGEATLSPLAEQLFEMAVALMLVGLGARGVRRAWLLAKTGPTVLHSHGRKAHMHATGRAAHFHVGRFALARRPFLVGLVHGLAGSGALTALVLAAIPTAGARIGYIVLFGLGSMVGMAVLSGLVGWPLARISRSPRAMRVLTASAGVFSASFGVYLGCSIAAGWVG